MNRNLQNIFLGLSIITQTTIAHIDYNKLDTQEMCSFLKQFIEPDSLVFDVGANIGNKTDLYLRLNAKVVCFEPQLECVNHLKNRFAHTRNVIIEHKGLAATQGVLEFFKCKEANTLSTFSFHATQNGRFAEHNYNWNQCIMVDVSTLDAMIDQYGMPQFCKIDVEGFEYEVLKGLTKKIPYLSFECNSEHILIAEQCVHYLSNLGYKKFNFAIGERGWFAFDNWLNETEFLREFTQLINNNDWREIWGLWGDVYASSLD